LWCFSKRNPKYTINLSFIAKKPPILQNNSVETNIRIANREIFTFLEPIGDVRMVKLHATAKITHDFEIAMDNNRGHSVLADQPTPTSPGSAATPLELCIMSHAGCYATIAALTAQKMRLDLKGCEVTIEAEKDPQTGTIGTETINILLKIDAPQDRIDRLHEVTVKTCPVGVLFELAGVKTTYNLQVQKV
jgi:putative redox protein